MSSRHWYRCSGRFCPGYPWDPGLRDHPLECSLDPEQVLWQDLKRFTKMVESSMTRGDWLTASIAANYLGSRLFQMYERTRGEKTLRELKELETSGLDRSLRKMHAVTDDTETFSGRKHVRKCS